MTLVGWLFTAGGILGYLTMLFHSLYKSPRRQTLFVFVGGVFAAFQLEITLVHLLHGYSYQNLPLTLAGIPIVIPLGWVITFYGLHVMAEDLIQQLGYEFSTRHLVITTGILAMFYGLGIEVLARNSEFWVFYFSNVEILGVPIIVTLAWGISVAVFSLGLIMIQPRGVDGGFGLSPVIVLLLVMTINTAVGWSLLMAL